MALQIITADQRMAEKKGHKIVVCGQSGVGKTTLARTLDGTTTLFMDLEAGDAAIEGHKIDVVRPKSWQECRDMACYLGGPNPSLAEDQPYSQAHYDYVSSVSDGTQGETPDKYNTLFVDSITVAGRLCFSWCQQQPESRSDRSGKLDTRAAYGLHGREMMAWLTHLQHIREKNVIFVGILDETTDDYGRKQYGLQIEGSKTGRELPGIVDEVITMAVLTGEHGPYRGFVCQPLNEWGYPAKDRSGRLETLEEPHLGKLIAKMSAPVLQNGKPLEFVDPITQQSEEKLMLNLNTIPQDDQQNREFSLIPNGSVSRAVMVVKSGEIELPEFGHGQWFKKSQSSNAKWLEIEFTCLGGEFDRRKFWSKIFVDGDKIGKSGMPVAKEIGLRTLRSIIESANNLNSNDMSDEAQQRRNISGVDDLNAMEICAKIGIKKGTNGYSDQNQLMAAMTPNQDGFIASGQPIVHTTPSAQQYTQPQQPAPAQVGSPVPSWASR